MTDKLNKSMTSIKIGPSPGDFDHGIRYKVGDKLNGTNSFLPIIIQKVEGNGYVVKPVLVDGSLGSERTMSIFDVHGYFILDPGKEIEKLKQELQELRTQMKKEGK